MPDKSKQKDEWVGCGFIGDVGFGVRPNGGNPSVTISTKAMIQTGESREGNATYEQKNVYIDVKLAELKAKITEIEGVAGIGGD